ncbi:hypothetical protein PV371_24700 [Streptomyces sp. TX20-6-3]|uniref:hypothetical protein n=1 Tax=Streptomyces sp. TX20-6-3 TaxID=3028705 RepID=UPI0029B3F484|nr:hypothetical protein [Streptomyces sp. TX20-6-3]MDX2562834.1 hypothetical protein [Streptomyces sp. TX20-6-3]
MQTGLDRDLEMSPFERRVHRGNRIDVSGLTLVEPATLILEKRSQKQWAAACRRQEGRGETFRARLAQTSLPQPVGDAFERERLQVQEMEVRLFDELGQHERRLGGEYPPLGEYGDDGTRRESAKYQKERLQTGRIRVLRVIDGQHQRFPTSGFEEKLGQVIHRAGAQREVLGTPLLKSQETLQPLPLLGAQLGGAE